MGKGFVCSLLNGKVCMLFNKIVADSVKIDFATEQEYGSYLYTIIPLLGMLEKDVLRILTDLAFSLQNGESPTSIIKSLLDIGNKTEDPIKILTTISETIVNDKFELDKLKQLFITLKILAKNNKIIMY